ncbi:hypothetical protein P171DRAFT_437279 [Karstenula rhodostoma CBS 690.94]|uniref:Uncharacterized protein n=1 Tax=Karstenula rhodostoma CBS 690.94 TaxID=1392251 RepID=A0A9P4U5Y7_9PLEO|nr:hypothetical protein P171DRAFT_437279 [Karstenula rhodostoma CBS 690.94]
MPDNPDGPPRDVPLTHTMRIPEELHISVTATEAQRPKYINILPLLLLAIQAPEHFTCKVVCGGKSLSDKPARHGVQSAFHTEFTDRDLTHSLRCLLFHNDKVWNERLRGCSYALWDMYHERHLVIVFPAGGFPGGRSSRRAAQEEMGFADSIGDCGLLTVDLHCADEFAGLVRWEMPETKSLREEDEEEEEEDDEDEEEEEEGEEDVPYKSQKWDFFTRPPRNDE